MLKYTSLKFAPMFFALFALFIACGDDGTPTLSSEEQLQAYFTEQNINPQKTDSGLYYIIEAPGSSDKPTRSGTVEVHYEGFFLDGEVFDSSFERGAPSEFSLRNVIRGWTEGIPLFGRGGKGFLYVPYELAYGDAGRGSIPGKTAIAFRIELIDF